MGNENKGLKPRKIPMRQCLGCNEHKPKMELIRIVRSPEVYDRMETELSEGDEA